VRGKRIFSTTVRVIIVVIRNAIIQSGGEKVRLTIVVIGGVSLSREVFIHYIQTTGRIRLCSTCFLRCMSVRINNSTIIIVICSAIVIIIVIVIVIVIIIVVIIVTLWSRCTLKIAMWRIISAIVVVCVVYLFVFVSL